MNKKQMSEDSVPWMLRLGTEKQRSIHPSDPGQPSRVEGGGLPGQAPSPYPTLAARLGCVSDTKESSPPGHLSQQPAATCTHRGSRPYVREGEVEATTIVSGKDK